MSAVPEPAPKKRGRKLIYDGKGAPELRVRVPPELLAAVHARGGEKWAEWVRSTLWQAVSQPR